MQSRCLEEHAQKLYDYAQALPSVETKELTIPQKGGRKARDVKLDVKYGQVTLKAPANKKSTQAYLFIMLVALSKGHQKTS
ncbi:Transposase DNA-binding [Vibrio sp. B1ASS3]|nr:Transposase DNA-binding [Vibrio sp. B1ASS3]CAE6881527.1 Transposase DNA-binding [Vibrio sp. B1ASS3]